jgi:hypothetical protein
MEMELTLTLTVCSTIKGLCSTVLLQLRFDNTRWRHFSASSSLYLSPTAAILGLRDDVVPAVISWKISIIHSVMYITRYNTQFSNAYISGNKLGYIVKIETEENECI